MAKTNKTKATAAKKRRWVRYYKYNPKTKKFGIVRRREVVDVQPATIMVAPSGNWPQLSDAMGVEPSQISEARAEAARAGVPTDFAPDGRAILTDRQHRRRYAEAMGLYDRNGGYGDPQKR